MEFALPSTSMSSVFVMVDKYLRTLRFGGGSPTAIRTERQAMWMQKWFGRLSKQVFVDLIRFVCSNFLFQLSICFSIGSTAGRFTSALVGVMHCKPQVPISSVDLQCELIARE